MKNPAFTLIEIAIVVIVIGLLVGGTLVGKDMIDAARIQATARYVINLNASMQTFKDQYDCLPGDCSTASSYGLGANGNGDLFVSANNNGADYEGMKNFFDHLNAAKLLDGGLNQATDRYGRYFIPMPLTGVYLYMVGASTTIAGNGGMALVLGRFEPCTSMCPANIYTFSSTIGLTSQQALSIDTILDDGMPNTGNVLAISTYKSTEANGNPAPLTRSPTGAPSASCASNTTATGEYTNLNSRSIACSLVIKINNK